MKRRTKQATNDYKLQPRNINFYTESTLAVCDDGTLDVPSPVADTTLGSGSYSNSIAMACGGGDDVLLSIPRLFSWIFSHLACFPLLTKYNIQPAEKAQSTPDANVNIERDQYLLSRLELMPKPIDTREQTPANPAEVYSVRRF